MITLLTQTHRLTYVGREEAKRDPHSDVGDVLVHVRVGEVIGSNAIVDAVLVDEQEHGGEHRNLHVHLASLRWIPVVRRQEVHADDGINLGGVRREGEGPCGRIGSGLDQRRIRDRRCHCERQGIAHV